MKCILVGRFAVVVVVVVFSQHCQHIDDKRDALLSLRLLRLRRQWPRMHVLTLLPFWVEVHLFFFSFPFPIMQQMPKKKEERKKVCSV